MEDEQQALPVGKRIAQWIDQRPRTIVGGGLLLVIVVIIANWALLPYQAPADFGFIYYDADIGRVTHRTLWDWLELLIVPVVLAAGAYWLNRSQKETELKIAEKARAAERAIADSRQKQAILEAYYDRMTELLLKHELGLSDSDSPVRRMALVRTVAAVKSLDGKRNSQLIAFLTVLSLKEYDLPVVDPTRIDFSEADMSGANLRKANLAKAILTAANLSKADLNEADLGGADLFEADLREANLSWADLKGAHLRRAKFHEANLSNADLSDNDLLETYLGKANLSQADLSRARNWTVEQFDEVATLAGATMPDGVILGGPNNDGPSYIEWKAQYLTKQGEQGT